MRNDLKEIKVAKFYRLQEDINIFIAKKQKSFSRSTSLRKSMQI